LITLEGLRASPGHIASLEHLDGGVCTFLFSFFQHCPISFPCKFLCKKIKFHNITQHTLVLSIDRFILPVSAQWKNENLKLSPLWQLIFSYSSLIVSSKSYFSIKKNTSFGGNHKCKNDFEIHLPLLFQYIYQYIEMYVYFNSINILYFELYIHI